MDRAHPIDPLAETATACAERLQAAESVLLASHIDADGLTSGAIAGTALERADIPFETVFFTQLDAAELESVAATDHETVLFTDFGSGQLDLIVEHETAGEFTPIVADHHQPADANTEYHLNPLLVGINGASELSGAGASYVLARALANTHDSETDNRDLAGLAVVGAVGDMQAGVDGLRGANTQILQEGLDAGVLAESIDLTLYGKQTRPLPKLLEYASDAQIPGISNNAAGTLEFLSGLDLELKRDGEWRCWVDLSADERQTLCSALVKRAVTSGVPADRIDELVGTSYQLTNEQPGTELRDVSEFSTLLNATARYERADVGLAVCLGDREAALVCARQLLRNHRQNLSAGLQWVKTEGVTTEKHVQWFDAGTEIRETIVGIIAGMAVGAPGVRRDLPIIAFAKKSDTEIKVSGRANHALTRNGVDLSVVMQAASRAVGGDGGGHDVAAGATIPVGTQQSFIEHADEIIGTQLGSVD